MITPEEREALRRRWYAEGRYGTADLAEELRRGTGGRLVFAARDRRVTMEAGDVVAAATRAAGGLTNLGIGKGDVVAIQAPASPDSVIVMAAAWLAGAVVLPLVTSLGRHELAFILAESRARVLCVPGEWRGVDYAARARGLGVEHVIMLGEHDGPLDHESPARQPVADPDEVCLLVYTSGTTANPKGVQHTHNSLLAALRPGVAAGRALATFPAGHIAGVIGVLQPLLRGGVTVVMDRWSAAHAAELIEEYRLESSAGTPFFLATLLDEAERSGRDISTLSRFLTGAASVPPSLMARARGAGIVSWRSYGSTEHPLISTGGPDDPEDKRHHTDGRVADGNLVRLVDESGADVAPGAHGEIVTRGPRQFTGYRDPALDTDAYLPGGWFRTGDIGRVDDDGYLIITDRKKDIIIRGGENIASREVEDLLARHPAVAEAAVCAEPDPLLGERVCAFVIPKPGGEIDLPGVRDHFARLGVARHKVPERLEVVDDLPRTAMGKVRKTELRGLLVDGAGEAGA
ncbi:AMP-binding protein [Nonomuraea sp. NPDC002799]